MHAAYGAMYFYSANEASLENKKRSPILIIVVIKTMVDNWSAQNVRFTPLFSF